MHQILSKVQAFLARATTEPVSIDEKLIEEFGERCKQIVREAFVEDKRKRTNISLSGVGKPSCQLHNDINRDDIRPRAYSDTMKFLFGHMIEALALFVMESAGVDISAKQKRVTLKIKDKSGKEYNISGSHDIRIDGKTWDIKSASSFSFDMKFKDFETLRKDDEFGYIPQLIGYSVADNVDAGGWVVINKETGEWKVVEIPATYNYAEALTKIANNLSSLSQPFTKAYTPVAEKFRGKETGNEILGSPCKYCEYLWECWPTVQYLPQVPSYAKDRDYFYYTHITDQYKELIESRKNTEE